MDEPMQTPQQPEAELVPSVTESAGKPVTAAVDIPADAKQPQPKRKLRRVIIAIATAAAVLIAGTAGGLLTGWYGLAGGPLGQLAAAVGKTLDNESVTTTFKLETPIGNEQSKLEGKLKLLIDSKEEEVTLLLDSKASGSVLATEIDLLLLDEVIYQISKVTMGGELISEAGSLEVDLDKFWEFYHDFKNKQSADWSEALEESEWKDAVEEDRIQLFLDTLREDCFGDREWLEKYLGFTKKGGSYRFDFEIKTLLNELVDVADACGLFKVHLDGITSTLIKQIDIQVEMGFEVKWGKLVAMDAEVNYKTDKEKQQIAVELAFSDIGKTVITEEEIDKVRDEVDEWTAKHTCSECGNLSLGTDGKCFLCAL